MRRASFDKTALLYNFVEKHICDDYASACQVIDQYLTLEPQETIIDVGGGTGLIAKELRKKNPVHDIAVIDLSRSMLRKIHDPTVSAIQGDVTVFPIKDKMFSLAILVNTMHHIPQARQQRALNEVFRILKRQGRIFIVDIWFPNTFLSNLFVITEKLLVGKTTHLTAETMERAVQDAGFHDIQVLFPKKNPYRYVIVGTKEM
jgi:ubiquinone/menaquinone biosynthesis C-methylase UbiE